MFSSLVGRTKKFGLKLTLLDHQPIGKAALSVLLLLDFFILVSIFQGLSDQTAQLTSPNEMIPAVCKDLVIEKKWVHSNRVVNTAKLVDQYHGSYFNPAQRQNDLHAVCKPLIGQLWRIKDDIVLSGKLGDLIDSRNQNQRLKFELESVKGAYDTKLLQKIAQLSELKNVEGLSRKVQSTSHEINKNLKSQSDIISALEEEPKIRSLFKEIDSLSDTSSKELLDDLRRLNFWHPVKKLGMEMIFLLPLFTLFYLWNLTSIRHSRPFQSLVSAHLMIIVFIPVLFKILDLIYDILPRKILKQVFDFLTSFNLIAIWHYLLMGVAILVAMSMIYFFQKKLFSQEKLISKRIAKGLCQSCGVKLPHLASACQDCGFSQFTPCQHCSKSTYVRGKHCIACGQTQN